MRTRFAPSPTGPLHLGHAFSAITAHDMARAAGGAFLLRIDDLDRTRARPEWEDLIYEDLEWLGLTWDGPVRRQADHLQDYRDALETLGKTGWLYPCACRRADIEAAATAPQEGGAPAFGPDGRIYPGTCRSRPFCTRTGSDAIRLDLARALANTETQFTEAGPAHRGCHTVTGASLLASTGDPVLARRDMAASYHFSVVLDDAASGITHVIRGEDLFEATHLHVALQHLLGVPTPIYHHHRLIRDDAGKRLAKRDDARAIRTYRNEGLEPEDIRSMLGL